MRRYLSAFCMALTVMGAMAQNSYIVKTKGAKKAESTVTANEQAAEEATEEPTDFIGANFKNIKLCNWTEGMRFMVMPEKYDLVVGAFCDAKTNRDVSCGKLKHKIMVYKGHSVAKDGTALVNFHCEDDNNDYYYPIPNGTFDDYCYLKLGVPTLAYLGDVDKARELLMGSTLYTRTTEFFVDTDYDSDGQTTPNATRNRYYDECQAAIRVHHILCDAQIDEVRCSQRYAGKDTVVSLN